MSLFSSEKTASCWDFKTEASKLYHDNTWGKPETNSRALFAQLHLEIFQAGQIILILFFFEVMAL
jgi:3-methyladenine DNA glycosylase Tag